MGWRSGATRPEWITDPPTASRWFPRAFGARLRSSARMTLVTTTWTPHRLITLFEDFGRSLAVSQEDGLAALVDLSVERVDGAAWASVTTFSKGQFATATSTGAPASAADAIQYDVGKGPCLDAAVSADTYRPTNLTTDDRWPEFGRRVADEVGMKSMVATRLLLQSDDVIAALNLYSDREGAFDDDDEITATLLATHAGIAFQSTWAKGEVRELRRAIDSNRDIGVAMGLLMARLTITRDHAFDLLRIASQRSNRKLVAVAAEVIATGFIDLPFDLPASPPAAGTAAIRPAAPAPRQNPEPEAAG